MPLFSKKIPAGEDRRIGMEFAMILECFGSRIPTIEAVIVSAEFTELKNFFDPKILLRAAAFPHAASSLKLLETHISWVVLTGKYAYNIKKTIQLPFVGNSTLELRKTQEALTSKEREFLCNPR